MRRMICCRSASLTSSPADLRLLYWSALMLLHHSRRKPIGGALPFDGVAVDRPTLSTFLIDPPTRVCWSHIDRVFYCKDEECVRNKRTVHRRHQPSKFLDIVEGQRTVSQVIRRLGQVHMFEVCND